jgi:hypothetical protein
MRWLLLLACSTSVASADPRRPHVEVTVEASDITDSDAVAKRLRALEPELTACWKRQVAATPHITRGNIDYDRTLAGTEIVASSKGTANFFDAETHKPVNAWALGACVFAILDRVPVASRGRHGKIFVDVACLN